MCPDELKKVITCSCKNCNRLSCTCKKNGLKCSQSCKCSDDCESQDEVDYHYDNSDDEFHDNDDIDETDFD